MDNMKNNQNKKMEPKSSVSKYKREFPDSIIRARNSFRKQRRLVMRTGLIGLFLIIGGSFSIGMGIGIYLLIIGLVMLVFAAAMGIVMFRSRSFLPHDYSGLYFDSAKDD